LTRAVFDPNVLIAAVLSPEGVPAGCMRAHAQGRFELLVSERLLAEVETVLARPKFRRYTTLDQAQRYVESLRRECWIGEDPLGPETFSEDPGDDYLIALALATEANVLVSGDKHLTGLTLTPVPVMSPRAFLERLPE
jgi:putative PIN family toxin of toxin-antitoxin system